jgi:anti-anti-sigma factor
MVVSVAAGCELVLSGQLDVRSAGDVREALHGAIEGGTGDLVVDVSGVDLIDATGLGVLLGAHRRAAQVGRRVVLRDASPRVARILRLTRLNRVFVVEPAG